MNGIIGVDLGMGSIKAVALNREGDNLELAAIGEVRNPVLEWLKSEDNKKEIDEVAKAVRELVKDLKMTDRQVVTALPEHEIVSRLVSLPPLKESEIRDALKFEAETFVPYPLDEVSIDYEVVETDDAGRLTVFVIAAKNSLIQSYIKVFKEVGMELVAIESLAVTMRRMVKGMGSTSEATMLVDIGGKYSNIVAFRNGTIYFARSMPVGGESLTRAISVNLGLDMASAEEYKKAYGMKDMELEGKIKNAIMPVFSSMAEEIRRAIALFNENNKVAISLLILSGGGAKMPGLAEELTRLLGIEVQVIQPFTKINTTRIVLPVDLNTEGYRFSLAAGLAMREE